MVVARGPHHQLAYPALLNPLTGVLRFPTVAVHHEVRGCPATGGDRLRVSESTASSVHSIRVNLQGPYHVNRVNLSNLSNLVNLGNLSNLVDPVNPVNPVNHLFSSDRNEHADPHEFRRVANRGRASRAGQGFCAAPVLLRVNPTPGHARSTSSRHLCSFGGAV
jgi:hypothetical protein